MQSEAGHGELTLFLPRAFGDVLSAIPSAQRVVVLLHGAGIECASVCRGMYKNRDVYDKGECNNAGKRRFHK